MSTPLLPLSFFRALGRFTIRSRRAALGSGQGAHLSPRPGHGIEFADYRAYAPGDDFRHIDWGIYGRSDRLYVRRYREEKELSVTILLDTSASVALPDGELKFEFMQAVATALTYVALSNGDTVHLIDLSHQLSTKISSMRQFHRGRQWIEGLVPEGQLRLDESIARAFERFRVTGKAFLLSDFFVKEDELEASMATLRQRNLDAAILCIRAPSEISLPSTFTGRVRDSESGEEIHIDLSPAERERYAKMLSEHSMQCQEIVRGYGFPFIEASSGSSVADFILTTLPQSGILK